ncbi:MAG: class I SAM-dependent methyltransferase [Cyanobacteria bacterium CRU_2_1]|nr:class I SAM-dependent methyltransferase [Cyanobacteria bacterium CRU_2_1]
MLVSKFLSGQTHDYQKFSKQYSDLGIEATYYLAFAEASKLIASQSYAQALDFGCGSGRSTRFLKTLDSDVIGVDTNPHMLTQARQLDPMGNYQLLDSKQLPFPAASFDLIFQSFVFLEYASIAQMIETLREFNRVLTAHGSVIIVTGSEGYYSHDWLSFPNNIPENQTLQSGDMARVSIRGTDIVLFDYYWTDQDYRAVFEAADFEVVEVLQPLAQGNEPFSWLSELEHPCWVIYSLRKLDC